MNGYLSIKKIFFPYLSLKDAYKHMRNAGSHGFEGVALFAGKESGNDFKIETAIIPNQKAMSLEEGLLYAVDGDELHRINVWLYENKMSLIAQIHSHPSKAYHSKTDDAFPIIATLGGLSIVVPDFAKGSIDVNTWAVYRLLPKSGWTELDVQEKSFLIELTE
jgi:hypothetical protein